MQETVDILMNQIIDNQKLSVHPVFSVNEEVEHAKNIIDDYANQMAENHAMLVDKNFWLVVKQKPKWMPDFLYKAVIKNLIEFQERR